MKIQNKQVNAKGLKFYVEKDGQEVARAYLYILTNELHDKPFGLMEDVFVDETSRGRGVGSELVKKVIQEARERGCYKLICTSRHENSKVHELYADLGFKEYGKEFRIDF